MSEFASQEQIAELGNGVFAVRSAGGKVPAQAIGVSLEGEMPQHYLPDGRTITPPSHGKLWWLYPQPQVLHFVPTPRSPEAGVALTLQAHFIAPDQTSPILRDWLNRQGAVVSTDDIVAELQGHPDLQLPPCVQNDELRQAKSNLSASMLRNMGWRCLHLELYDLYPDKNCHQQVLAQSAHVQTQAPSLSSFFNGVEDNDAGAANSASENATITAQNSAQLIDKDAKLAARFFHELPQLSKQMRSLPWPKTLNQHKHHQAAMWQLDRMASTIGRLPALASLVDPKRLQNQEMALLVAQARKASYQLDQLWGLIQSMADAGEVYHYGQLFRVLAALEQALAQRCKPWWERK